MLNVINVRDSIRRIGWPSVFMSIGLALSKADSGDCGGISLGLSVTVPISHFDRLRGKNNPGVDVAHIGEGLWL
jgi:hypothetical protein